MVRVAIIGSNNDTSSALLHLYSIYNGSVGNYLEIVPVVVVNNDQEEHEQDQQNKKEHEQERLRLREEMGTNNDTIVVNSNLSNARSGIDDNTHYRQYGITTINESAHKNKKVSGMTTMKKNNNNMPVMSMMSMMNSTKEKASSTSAASSVSFYTTNNNAGTTYNGSSSNKNGNIYKQQHNNNSDDHEMKTASQKQEQEESQRSISPTTVITTAMSLLSSSTTISPPPSPPKPLSLSSTLTTTYCHRTTSATGTTNNTKSTILPSSSTSCSRNINPYTQPGLVLSRADIIIITADKNNMNDSSYYDHVYKMILSLVNGSIDNTSTSTSSSIKSSHCKYEAALSDKIFVDATKDDLSSILLFDNNNMNSGSSRRSDSISCTTNRNNEDNTKIRNHIQWVKAFHDLGQGDPGRLLTCKHPAVLCTGTITNAGTSSTSDDKCWMHDNDSSYNHNTLYRTNMCYRSFDSLASSLPTHTLGQLPPVPPPKNKTKPTAVTSTTSTTHVSSKTKNKTKNANGVRINNNNIPNSRSNNSNCDSDTNKITSSRKRQEDGLEIVKMFAEVSLGLTVDIIPTQYYQDFMSQTEVTKSHVTTNHDVTIPVSISPVRIPITTAAAVTTNIINTKTNTSATVSVAGHSRSSRRRMLSSINNGNKLNNNDGHDHCRHREIQDKKKDNTNVEGPSVGNICDIGIYHQPTNFEQNNVNNNNMSNTNGNWNCRDVCSLSSSNMSTSVPSSSSSSNITSMYHMIGIMMLLFVFTEFYSILRYIIIGGMGWSSLPLYITNKAMAWTSITGFTMSCVLLASQKRRKRQQHQQLRPIATSTTVTTKNKTIRSTMSNRRVDNDENNDDDNRNQINYDKTNYGMLMMSTPNAIGTDKGNKGVRNPNAIYHIAAASLPTTPIQKILQEEEAKEPMLPVVRVATTTEQQTGTTTYACGLDWCVSSLLVLSVMFLLGHILISMILMTNTNQNTTDDTGTAAASATATTTPTPTTDMIDHGAVSSDGSDYHSSNTTSSRNGNSSSNSSTELEDIRISTSILAASLSLVLYIGAIILCRGGTIASTRVGKHPQYEPRPHDPDENSQVSIDVAVRSKGKDCTIISHWIALLLGTIHVALLFVTSLSGEKNGNSTNGVDQQPEADWKNLPPVSIASILFPTFVLLHYCVVFPIYNLCFHRQYRKRRGVAQQERNVEKKNEIDPTLIIPQPSIEATNHHGDHTRFDSRHTRTKLLLEEFDYDDCCNEHEEAIVFEDDDQQHDDDIEYGQFNRFQQEYVHNQKRDAIMPYKGSNKSCLLSANDNNHNHLYSNNNLSTHKDNSHADNDALHNSKPTPTTPLLHPPSQKKASTKTNTNAVNSNKGNIVPQGYRIDTVDSNKGKIVLAQGSGIDGNEGGDVSKRHHSKDDVRLNKNPNSLEFNSDNTNYKNKNKNDAEVKKSKSIDDHDRHQVYKKLQQNKHQRRSFSNRGSVKGGDTSISTSAAVGGRGDGGGDSDISTGLETVAGDFFVRSNSRFLRPPSTIPSNRGKIDKHHHQQPPPLLPPSQLTRTVPRQNPYPPPLIRMRSLPGVAAATTITTEYYHRPPQVVLQTKHDQDHQHHQQKPFFVVVSNSAIGSKNDTTTNNNESSNRTNRRQKSAPNVLHRHHQDTTANDSTSNISSKRNDINKKISIVCGRRRHSLSSQSSSSTFKTGGD